MSWNPHNPEFKPPVWDESEMKNLAKAVSGKGIFITSRHLDTQTPNDLFHTSEWRGGSRLIQIILKAMGQDGGKKADIEMVFCLEWFKILFEHLKPLLSGNVRSHQSSHRHSVCLGCVSETMRITVLWNKVLLSPTSTSKPPESSGNTVGRACD